MTVVMLREDLVNLTVEDYAELLRVGAPFAQANYGDGEWGCLLGAQGQNVNGERYVPALRDALRETLLAPREYLYGTNPGQRWRVKAERYVRKEGVEDRIRWVWKDTLSGANVRGELGPVLHALRERDVLLVGPPHLRGLPEDVMGPHDFVEVHPHQAWKDAEATAETVRPRVLDGAVVLFAAGMASNLMIHALWPEAWAAGSVLLDVGALFDPYVGHYTRKHYKRQIWRDVWRVKNIAEGKGEAYRYDLRAYWGARAHDYGPSYVGPGSHKDKSAAEAVALSRALDPVFRGRKREFELFLDFGCGSGRLTSFFQDRVGSYVGVDLSPAGLAHAQRAHPEALFLLLTEDFLPFETDCFDGGAAVLVFQHIPDEALRLWAAQLARVLRPGAPFVVVDEEREEGTEYAFHVHPRTPEEVGRLLGKEARVVEHLGTGHWLGWFV